MHLLLIRHAETGHNRDSRVQGQADIPLSDLGMRQAAALGAYLQHESFTTIIASPLARALATAQAVARYHDVPVSVEPDLMEMHVGDMEGLSTVEMRDRFPEFLAEWVTERGPALEMPGGESLIQVQQRVWAVVERLHQRDRDARVALISHNFVLSALLTRALDMPLHEFRRFRLSVSGVSTLRLRPERTVLVRLNDTCHLRAAGLPSTDPWAARAPRT